MGIFGYKGEKTNIEHYRNDEDGPVTKVVDTFEDGSVDTYSKSSGIFGSKGYSHKSTDSSGNTTYDRPEGRKTGKFNDYILKCLSELSFVELQIVEVQTTNEYVKRSARYLMQTSL